MKVLITGATGLVGRRVAKKLLLQGHQLTVVGRSVESDFRKSFTLPCQYIQWSSLHEMPDVEAVIHLAGDPIAGGRWTEKKKRSIIDSRVDTSRRLLQAAQKSGNWPKHFLSASAIGIYPNRGDEFNYEDSPYDDGFLAQVCQKWERSTLEFSEFGRLVHLRIGIVLDPLGGMLQALDPIFSSALGGKISWGEQWMSWIHIDDLVSMILFILDNNEVKGVVNAVAPHPVTNKVFTEVLSNQFQLPALFPVPKFVMRVAFGEMSQLATDSQRVSADKILDLGFHFRFSEISDGLQDLYSWKTTPNDRLFQVEQWLPLPLDRVFSFFADIRNLEKLTPEWLNFHLEGMSTEQIRRGSRIDYRLKINGFPVKWQSEIQQWQPPHKFVDVQTKGPYSYWHHTHEFEEFAEGTLIIDQVIYRLPVSYLGRWVAGSFVQGDIEKIFNYRHQVIGSLSL